MALKIDHTLLDICAELMRIRGMSRRLTHLRQLGKCVKGILKFKQ